MINRSLFKGAIIGMCVIASAMPIGLVTMDIGSETVNAGMIKEEAEVTSSAITATSSEVEITEAPEPTQEPIVEAVSELAEEVIEVKAEPQKATLADSVYSSRNLIAKVFRSTVKAVKEKAQARHDAQVAAQKAIEKEEKYINQLLDKASNVPNGESGCKSQFKSWMRATSISAKRSGQWKLLHDDRCYEDPETHFMMFKCDDGDRICCALGSYYTELIGTKVDIIFQDGHMIKCILADQKANQHTDKSNRYHLCDGSVLEFVVGTGFKGDNTYPEWTKGKIHYINVLDAVNDGEGFKWDW